MEETYFRDYDKLAFEKHQTLLERRAVLDPSPPGPTEKALYSNVMLHKSSNYKKYENKILIQEKKEALKREVTNSRAKSMLLQQSAINKKNKKKNDDDGESANDEGNEDDIFQDSQSMVSKSSQSLLEANRSVMTLEEVNAWLTSHGFDPDYISKPMAFGWSPIHQCAEEGNLLMMMWLFEHLNKNVETLKKKDDSGITPLQLASMRTDLSMCRWLHNNGAAEVYKFDPYL